MCAEWLPVFSPDGPYMLPMARLFIDLIEVQFLSLDIAGWLSLVQKKDVCWAVDCSGLVENWTSIISHTGRTVL